MSHCKRWVSGRKSGAVVDRECMTIVLMGGLWKGGGRKYVVEVIFGIYMVHYMVK